METRATVVTVLALDMAGNPTQWKLNEPVPGNDELIVRRMVPIDGGVSVFAVPLEGSKLETSLAQQTGVKCGHRFHLAASGVRIVASMAPLDLLKQIVEDTLDNADDNFETEPEDPEEPEDEPDGDEPEVEAAPPPAPPQVQAADQPTSFLPASPVTGDVL